MRDILITRLIHWKKQWAGILFWLVLPIIATILITFITQGAQQETKVPVGIVLDEETPLTENLLSEIGKDASLEVQHLNETEALHLLETHQLDSVFVIKNGYEEQIRKGNRDQLITGYYSDLSFAYSPVKETITSLVLQETSRSKAAYTIKHLADADGFKDKWTWDEIVKTSKQVQKDENLFVSTFAFLSGVSGIESSSGTLLNPWSIWVLWNALVTLMLFDWLIKEKQNHVSVRFSFMRFSYPGYAICNAILYFILQFCFTIVAAAVFHVVLDTSFHFSNWYSLFAIQFMLTAGAMLLALLFNSTYLYYSVSIAIVLLLAIAGGTILPLDHLTGKFPWIANINPLNEFLHGKINYYIPALFLVLISSWYFFKRKS